MVPVMMVMMISSDGATRGRVCDQLQGRHHRCAQVSFLAVINMLKHVFSEKGFLLLLLFQSINFYSRYVPGENSGARKSSRKKGTLMILIKVIIISMSDDIEFPLSLIIILAMSDDNLCCLSDHHHCYVR